MIEYKKGFGKNIFEVALKFDFTRERSVFYV